MQASAAISGATVEVDVVANANSTTKLASQIYSNQNFAAAAPLAISWNYPSTLPVGSYCAAITVTDSGGAVLLSSNNCTTSFIVANAGYTRGVNIMDLASAGGTYPGVYGTDYTKPDLASLTYLQSRGLKVVRLPFLWERVQPTAGGALDAGYLGLILAVMHDANTAGIKVMLDMHNYGHYFNNAFGDGAGPSQAQYADVWSKLALAVQADSKAAPALYAYDVMNEPYGLTATATLLTPQKVWEAYSQAAVNGIRSTSDHSLIMVEGYFYASAAQWPQNHPVAWITDTANNSMYQAHLYLDNDSSGTYQLSHASELADATSQGYATVGARAVARVKNFTDWVSSQNVRGFVGEVGWPNSVVVGATDGASWNTDGDLLFSFLDSVNMGRDDVGLRNLANCDFECPRNLSARPHSYGAFTCADS